MTAGPGSACFHCGEPIPAGVRIAARIDAREEPVCCHGCKAVAEFITGAGLDDYYKYRDRAGARADESPRPDRWSAYDRPELVERLTRAEAERRALDHRAAGRPALLGLQLARRQGAAPAERRARRQRESGHCPRTAGVGAVEGAAWRPAARARARRAAAASARRRTGRADRTARTAQRAEAARGRGLRHDAGDDVRAAALRGAHVGHGARHARVLPPRQHAGVHSGRASTRAGRSTRAPGTHCGPAA